MIITYIVYRTIVLCEVQKSHCLAKTSWTDASIRPRISGQGSFKNVSSMFFSPSLCIEIVHVQDLPKLYTYNNSIANLHSQHIQCCEVHVGHILHRPVD